MFMYHFDNNKKKQREEWKEERREREKDGMEKGKREEEKNFRDIIQIIMKWSLIDQMWFYRK